MGIIKHLDIIPTIDPSLSSTNFIVEAGWGTPSSITGVIRLVSSKPLKEAKLILEFQGQSETHWSGAKVRKPGDPPGETFVRRFQLVTAVVRDSKDSLEPNEFGATTLPFSLNLPAHGLPPSFGDSRGSIKYNLKSTLTWSETFQLLKPIHIANAAITIVMPRSHRLKLLQTPSSLEYDTSYDASKCTCSIRLPTRVYIPGQQFTVQFAVLCTPKHRTIAAVQLSIEGSTTYRSIASDPTQRNRNAVVWNPFPLATTREHPAPGELDSRNPNIPVAFSRTVQLVTDPKYHHPTLESSIISSRSVVKVKIFLDSDTEPHMAFETAIVVVPSDTIKETAVLRALEIAREQVRPAHEIALTSAASALLHRTKGSGFTTTASIIGPASSGIPRDSISTISTMASYSRSSIGPSSHHSHYLSNGHLSSTTCRYRSTAGSSSSEIQSVNSSDASINTRASTMAPPPRYSVSLRSLDIQSAHANTTKQTPEESVLLTPVSASVSSKLHNEYKSQGLSFAQDDTLHEGDATFEGLLTIDELASRLAGVGLTHKDVGLLTVQAPLDSKRASKDSMVDIQMLISGHDHDIRMDSGYSYDAIDAKDLPVQQRHEQQPSLPSVSQSAGSVPNHHPITDTFNPEHAVPLATVETGVVATKLQSLLNSLANPSSTPLASSHSVMPHTEARHTDIDTSENPASPSASGRSNQIQQIDDLLDALLAFEQDNQFDDSEYDPLMEPATPPDFLAPGIVVPVRSSSTRSSQSQTTSSTGLYPNSDYPLPLSSSPPSSSLPPSSSSLPSPLSPSPSFVPSLSQPLLPKAQIEGTATLLCISNTPITIGEPSVSFPLLLHPQSSNLPYVALDSSSSTLPRDDSVIPRSRLVAKFTVVACHIPKRDDELPLSIGDLVGIYEVFRDGWCWGYNIDTKSEGSFPMKKVHLLGQSCNV
ncbi:hypothetical protein BASA50_007176 [Batrachochytrium salamandrivorans]|uniref:SH3 domain-containing protein n=1 Tax=Batrachochytrium salamandrivorans TaxID=1357716 RepID=A0ABQ8F8C8_9FUNG|nr:hypothetical protein BASA50_007176 [Batrachochytrium salamandrivorans]